MYGNEGFFHGARITAIIGGLAIAIGVLTFSKRVMMTVGGAIAEISQVDGFVVIVASALTVVLMGNIMGIPVSTSQSVVGAVVGAGLVNSVKSVNFGVFKRIAIAWVSSPPQQVCLRISLLLQPRVISLNNKPTKELRISGALFPLFINHTVNPNS